MLSISILISINKEGPYQYQFNINYLLVLLSISISISILLFFLSIFAYQCIVHLWWPGFEPQTSSIRRRRSIHSATPHLADLHVRQHKFYSIVEFVQRLCYQHNNNHCVHNLQQCAILHNASVFSTWKLNVECENWAQFIFDTYCKAESEL